MNKWQSIDAFWNSFGWDAYDENSVYTGEQSPTPPYITYNAQTAALNENLTLTASLWDRNTSWKNISDKADEIAREFGYGYITLLVDGGYLYITKGQPFAQRMPDEDDMIRRIYIILNAEFLTAY